MTGKIQPDSNRSIVKNAAKTLKKRRVEWETVKELNSESFEDEDIAVASKKTITTTNLQVIREDEAECIVSLRDLAAQK